MKKMKKLLGILLVTCLLLVACQGKKPATGEQKLHIAIEKTINSFNHHVADLAPEFEIITQFMEGLVRFDENQNVVLVGAKSIDVSEDGLHYTIKLNEQAKWSDNTPVTAHDYEFAIKEGVASPRSAGKEPYVILKNAKAIIAGTAERESLGVKAIDATTLEIDLEHPSATFINTLIGAKFFPIKQEFYEAQGGSEGYGTGPETTLTNGAFKLVSYEANSNIVLEKSETYWDAANVTLDTLEISIIPELTTQKVMFDKGELDVIRIQGELSDVYQDKENVLSGLESRLGSMYLSNTINGNADIFKNKNMRAAIAHAIDKSIITENIVKGGATPLEGLFLKGYYKVDGKDLRDYNTQFTTPIFDIKKAQEYLANAKTELGKDEITFTFKVQDTVIHKKTFENVKAQIEENLPGVTMVIETLPNQLYFSEILKKETTAGMITRSASTMDLYTLIQLFEKSNSINFADYNNPEFQALVDQAKVEPNIQKQADLYLAAEKLLIEDYVFLPLYQQGIQYKLQPTVKGMKVNPVIPTIDYKYVYKG